ncbi:cephalosporin esterase [Moniliophthora roreri]|nr:cephalosporin esterase [Moniliophthora roreri]
MKNLVVLLSLLVAQTIASSFQPRSPQQGVTIDLGYARYQGVFDPSTDVTDFIGVRYAAPPTGILRWQAPQPPAPTTGVQIANVNPPQCLQASGGSAPTNPFSTSHARRQTPTASEDCLFLHVHFPGDTVPTRKLPVVVWIHGGGYVSGDAIGFHGSDLIKESDNGVVAVLIQYRLGLFGFLAGSKVKEGGALNAGLLDQNFALRWVQQHISKFGGDPTQVTIWGQSAGAGSVIQHVIAEDGRTTPQLFRGAMTSSTFLPSQYMFNDPIPESLYNQVVTQTSCSSAKDSLACLRATDVNVLETANRNISSAAFFGTFAFVPVVDGTFITQRATEAFKKGRVNGKAVLAVTNTNEGPPFVNQSAPADAARYASSVFPRLGPREVMEAAKQYAAVGSPLDQVNQIMTDSIFVCPTYFLLNAFKDRGFKGELAIPPATHGLDVGYYFPS